MSRASIQATIKTALEAVTGVENVYDDEIDTSSIAKLKSQAVQQDGLLVQYWVLRREASMPHTGENDRGRVVVGSQVQWYHTFSIRLFIGRNAGYAETEFQSLIDAVLTAFQAKRTLGGWNTPAPLALASTRDHVWSDMAGRLAEFRIEVIEIVEGLQPQ